MRKRNIALILLAIILCAVVVILVSATRCLWNSDCEYGTGWPLTMTASVSTNNHVETLIAATQVAATATAKAPS